MAALCQQVKQPRAAIIRAAFDLIDLDPAVAERAVQLRRIVRLKRPDAIVRASAQSRSMLCVTRDETGFPPDDPGVRIPYRL